MPKWICPSCSAVMTVKPEIVGRDGKCVKCGVVDKVIDTDAVMPNPLLIKGEHEYWATTLGRAVITVVAILWVLGSWVALNRMFELNLPASQSGPLFTEHIGSGLLAVALWFVGWCILNAVDETRANRRILEFIAKNTRP